MKIVLTRPYYDSHFITPPLSLGYLSSYLQQNDIECVIIDGLKERLSPDKLALKIAAEKPDAVGITCLTAYYNEVVELTGFLKTWQLRCIIGGLHPTFLPHLTLIETGAEYIICGEGEIALTKLLKNNFINDGIPGVHSLADVTDDFGPVTRGEIVDNLDDLPFPDWKQMDPGTYPIAPHGAFIRDFPIGILITSRGCPFSCTFCASPGFSERRIRYRSPDNVINELKLLVDRYGVKEIHFEDDNLTFKRDHALRLCKLILDNHIKVSWSCPNGVRADKVDEELLQLMARSGCYYLSFGIESANPQILKSIQKKESIEAIGKAINLADRQGITCQGFFIFGLPGETINTMKESISFAVQSRLSRIQIGILDVLPGSELWETLRGKFKPNWKKKYFKEPEWIPDNLTREDIIKAQQQAFREFYFRPRIILKLLKTLKIRQLKYILKILLDYRILAK